MHFFEGVSQQRHGILIFYPFRSLIKYFLSTISVYFWRHRHMIRTIVWYLYFWVYMVFSITFIFPLLFFRIIRQQKAYDKYLYYMARIWARSLVLVAGGRVKVRGLEHLPKESNICFISNHQGVFDIPIIMGYVPKPLFFIAKKELMFIPILGFWIAVSRCIFIDRKNKRQSVQAIQKGVDQIKQGYPTVIFPEGTRSQSDTMGEFKSGSLKLALRSNARIVPLTTNGSYKIREEKKGIIASADITLTIHPVIDVSTLAEEEKKDLAGRLWKIVNSGLKK